jgi:hypothetical protein
MFGILGRGEGVQSYNYWKKKTSIVLIYRWQIISAR